MSEMVLPFQEFYWAHREAFRVAAAGSVFVGVQLVILLWTIRRLAELSNIRERMSRLADGLALLTDTTESGLATIAAQLDQMSRKTKTVRPVSRATVAKRVTEAARKGDRIHAIAAHEALSESEVRLHLALSNDRALSPDSPLAS